MVVRTAAVVLGLVAAGSAMHGSRAELPGWLAGCWELRQGARHGVEMWMPPEGGMMLGASRVTVDGRVREYEQLRLDLTRDTLVYKDGAHLATYTGAPAVLKAGTDGNIEASRIDLRLAEASRSLERLDASRSKDPRGDFTGETIFATLEGGREARGDVLVYDALTGRYTLKGKPLFIKSKESDGTCSLSSGSEAMFSKEGGDPQFPREKNPGGSSSEKKDCSISIRAIK